MSERSFTKSAFIVLALSLSLTGCGEAQKSSRAPVLLDQRLAEIYARTCMGCHTVPDSGAPMTHNAAMWEPRMTQSDDVLLAHMVDGFGGMPPLGQCVECSAEDLTTLMHFMAAPAPAATN
ncbi:MAG: c-type cytochrome [Parvibaculum sp.]|nr:c-type cytochrome [Parvibaculum sp.]